MKISEIQTLIAFNKFTLSELEKTLRDYRHLIRDTREKADPDSQEGVKAFKLLNKLLTNYRKERAYYKVLVSSQTALKRERARNEHIK